MRLPIRFKELVGLETPEGYVLPVRDAAVSFN